jgi:dTDP-4-amino-4,6-dideoxygalactose transaminase
VREALESGWLTMGPRIQEFEAAYAELLGCKHAIALSSCTAALHLAYLAVGVGPGDEVVVPSMSFAATANAVLYCGGTPVFADIVSRNDLGLDVADVAERITDRTKAVCAMHYAGYPAAVDRLRELCDARGIALVEDAAHSPSAELDGRKLGTWGTAGCFSFFSNKVLSVGEGGLLATEDDGVAERVRSLRSHGMTSGTWDRHRGHAETYDIVDLGFNYRLDEPRAAMAHAHLADLDDHLATLRGTVAAYRERIAGIDGVDLPFSDEQAGRSGHFGFPVLVGDGELRDRVRSRLAERGVQTTFYPAITTLSLYREAGREHPCPRSEDFASRHMALPLSTSMGPEDVALACDALAEAVAAG